MKATRKSEIWRTIPILVAVCLVSIPAHAKYGGGSGTADDPYRIWTAEQMNTIGAEPNDWDKHFKLMDDVDLSNYTGHKFNIIGKEEYMYVEYPFTGTFEGQYHRIHNFSYERMQTFFAGLFLGVGNGGVIRNVGLVRPSIKTGGCLDPDFCVFDAGALAGTVFPGGRIENCWVELGEVIGQEDVGCLVGLNAGVILQCWTSGTVKGHTCVGGVVGSNAGQIGNCYSDANVLGVEDIGGLVGANLSSEWWPYSAGQFTHGGTIWNSYSVGHVEGTSSAGGLIGRNERAVVLNCFWDVDTSGLTSSGAGVGKHTRELQTGDVFASWGYCPSWRIEEGRDYPRLLWENTSGSVMSTAYPWKGDGTVSSPYLICTEEDLDAIGIIPCAWDRHFRLTANLDLTEFAEAFHPIGGAAASMPFIGTFAGNGFTISNLSINTTENHVGLFRSIAQDARILNLTLENFSIETTGDYAGSLAGHMSGKVHISCCSAGCGQIQGDDCVGGLVGFCQGQDCLITDCQSTDTIAGSYMVGGLIGYNRGIVCRGSAAGRIKGYYSTDVGGLVGANYGTIQGCRALCDMNGTKHWIGGIAGWNYGTISWCHSSGRIYGVACVGGITGQSDARSVVRACSSQCDVSGSQHVGGVAGRSEGSISLCWSEGFVNGTGGAYPYDVGGLVGLNEGSVSNSLSLADVIGSRNVGGLVGENRSASISFCLAAGRISGDSMTAGFVGYDYEMHGRFQGCLWDTTINPELAGIGNSSDPEVIGETSQNLRTRAPFLTRGWDFIGESLNGTEDIWAICEGIDYPHLAWEFAIGDFDADADTDFADFCILAEHWLAADSSFWCGSGGADLTNDGKVDFSDLRYLAESWLASVEYLYHKSNFK